MASSAGCRTRDRHLTLDRMHLKDADYRRYQRAVRTAARRARRRSMDNNNITDIQDILSHVVMILQERLRSASTSPLERDDSRFDRILLLRNSWRTLRAGR